MVVQQSEYTKNIHFKMVNLGTYLVVQGLGVHTSIAGSKSLIPGQGTKTLYAMRCGQKKKKPKLKKSEFYAM